MIFAVFDHRQEGSPWQLHIARMGVFGPRKVFLPLLPADRFKTDRAD